MSTASKIEFDYSKALAQAEKLEDIAAEINNLSQSDLENSLQELRSGWEGEAFLLYMSKGERLREKISKTSRELNDAAKTIRRIAKNIYNAEMAALEIARSRMY